MADSLYDLAPAIIPFIALLVGLFLGRLLAIKPEKGERGDVGEPGMTGPMGMPGERGLPGELAPHSHRIRDIAGLAEILGVHDQDSLATRMKAFARDSVTHGDMTPAAARMLDRIIEQHEENNDA